MKKKFTIFVVLLAVSFIPAMHKASMDLSTKTGEKKYEKSE